MRFFIIFFIALFITGCAAKEHQESQIIFYGELCSKSVEDCLISELGRNGANVFYLGDHMKVEIPIDKVFYNGTSSNLIDHPQILEIVAKWLQCYQKITVRIQINTGSDDALSRMRRMEQGEAVLRYLNTKSIDARWVYLSQSDTGSLPGYPTLVITTHKLP